MSDSIASTPGPNNARGAPLVKEKPGHGLDVEDTPDEMFPNAISNTGDEGSVMDLISLREVTMLGFINAVTDKPEWTKKVFDEAIISKWKAEAVKVDVPNDQQMTEKMFNYCVKELQHRAQQHQNVAGSAIHVLPGDVYKSDTAVSEETKVALQNAVRVLENVPANEKDWHPGSDGKVLDLVHPSLFPLVYGVSKILPIGATTTSLDDCIQRCGEGETIPANDPYKDVNWYHKHSRKFQWLPCEVDISGEKPKIVTYINNLHPTRHWELYTIVEDVIAATLPLWELTLAPFADKSYAVPRRIEYTCAEYEEAEGLGEEPEQEEDEDEDTYNARWDAWNDAQVNSRIVTLPEPEEFSPLPEPAAFKLKEMCSEKGKTLQVIVKLANIELTPEKPEYEGGTWHVEGQMNESICASAIYYYSSSNITASSLAFRQQSREPDFDDISYEQNFDEWLPAVFGVQNQEDTIQNLGGVDTREGRLVTFPNILQHQVQPFKLADPTKPGHRKILALFLVDPNADVISTADIPAQRRDWWQEVLLANQDSQEPSDKLKKLPVELQDLVFDSVDGFPIDMEKAKEYREALMEERKKFVLKNCEEFASTSISLCEH